MGPTYYGQITGREPVTVIVRMCMDCSEELGQTPTERLGELDFVVSDGICTSCARRRASLLPAAQSTAVIGLFVLWGISIYGALGGSL